MSVFLPFDGMPHSLSPFSHAVSCPRLKAEWVRDAATALSAKSASDSSAGCAICPPPHVWDLVEGKKYPSGSWVLPISA